MGKNTTCEVFANSAQILSRDEHAQTLLALTTDLKEVSNFPWVGKHLEGSAQRLDPKTKKFIDNATFIVEDGNCKVLEKSGLLNVNTIYKAPVDTQLNKNTTPSVSVPALAM